ncbi:hypothetical protein [Xanthomonas graminis]|uniref:Uncharacterized protein n=1 Tax=Xanthomonas graminis pv. arrhenatheri LMG 727 TaxID=1195923 RepID=A0A0K2ZIM5_9XANT|nr:hypothetical protein [Xanthomonas translucens]UKE76258.1 hypothetical protein KM317_12235 [Xanthomonas translucens pv. arrhenatheri]CTP84089.1 hypothetical protein XTALMG727_0859 [Xanthomonas translucens pv. arrhenatheri LMG 727]
MKIAIVGLSLATLLAPLPGLGLLTTLSGCNAKEAEEPLKVPISLESATPIRDPAQRLPSYPSESNKLLPDGTGKEARAAGLINCSTERIASHLLMRCASGSGVFEGLNYESASVLLGPQGRRMGDGSWYVPKLSEVEFVDLAYTGVEYLLGPLSYPPSPDPGFRNRYDYVLATRGWVPDAQSWGSDTFPRRYFKHDSDHMLVIMPSNGNMLLSVYRSEAALVAVQFSLLAEYHPDAVNKVEALARRSAPR